MSTIASDIAGIRTPSTLSRGPSSIDAERRHAFARILGVEDRESAGVAPRDAGDHERQAREAAEGLVALTFIQPVLRQMRESSEAAPPFAPTEAEKQMGALMDARTAEELVRAANFPLVERLARGPHAPAQPEQNTRDHGGSDDDR